MAHPDPSAYHTQWIAEKSFLNLWHGLTVDSTGKYSRASRKIIYLSWLIVLLVMASSTTGHAAEVKITPQLSVGGAYDDNINYSAKNEIDSTIVTISPVVRVNYTTPLSNLLLKADWDILRYLDESDYDRTNQYYNFVWNQRIKNRLDIFTEFDYRRDTTLNSYLQETGRVVGRVDRDFFDGSVGAAYDVTMVSGISAQYSYQNASYNSNAYSDYDNHRGNLYYYHRLKSQVDKLSIGPSYYHRNNDSNTVDSYSLDFVWDRDWSSISHTKASIGGRYNQIKQDNGTEDDAWGVKAGFDMNFQGVATTTTIRYFHDIRTTTNGDDVNVDNFFLNYSRLLTERFGLGLDGRLVFSYKLLSQQSNVNDERYYWLEPNLFYRWTENLNMSLRYRYQNNVEFSDEGDITRVRNIVWLQFSYGFPFLL